MLAKKEASADLASAPHIMSMRFELVMVISDLLCRESW